MSTFSLATPATVDVVRERVLVVDDDDHVRAIVKRVLMRAGYVVEEACTGAQALAAIRKGFSPELVIADIVMPGMCGESMVRRIREHYPAQPVLYVTGHSRRVVQRQTTAIRPDDLLLCKPFSSQALLEAVSAALKASRTETHVVRDVEGGETRIVCAG